MSGFLERPAKKKDLKKNYPIFMGISKKIGQDSEGFPIFKLDKNYKPTDELDHDLNDILNDYRSFRSNKLKESEYRFSIRKSENRWNSAD